VRNKKSPTGRLKNTAGRSVKDSPKATTKAVKTGMRAKHSWTLPPALKVTDTYRRCATSSFKFKDTNAFGKSHDIISQDRAVGAINMGLGIRKPGYNIYVAGIQGTGKTSVIRTFLEKWSADSATPNDWIYVHDFADQEAPHAIDLPAGDGRKFKKQMETLVKNLRDEIPSALQSEDYENAVNAYLSASNERKAKLYADLEKLAKGMDFIVKSSRMGIETIPVFDGRALTEKEYSKLSDADRHSIEERRSQLEPEVLDFARKVRAIEQETNEYVEHLRGELGLTLVGREIDPLIAEYEPVPKLAEYLKAAKAHMLENLLDFVEVENDQETPEMAFAAPDERDPFRKYRVNVFIDNTTVKGAPVIIETNPTYYNLFGRIEKNVEHGMYLTDFTMIKAGSIHRAAGGYLVLNAMDVFKTPSIWDTLKRVLKNRLGFIEDMGEQYSLLPTSGLRPVPIPLDVKVIMIGNDEIYHALFDGDEDFHKIFKIKADFDYRMPRNDETVNAYASFVATRTHVEGLLPFDKDGIAAIVEFGSRLVEDQRFLSTQFSEIKDLTIESDYLAREANAKLVTRAHVEKALNQKFHRLNLVEEQLLEMVRNEDILLAVEGERIGQVNGLAVYDMGDYSFGKLGRITCTISTSDDGVINIERASKLSGKIHDKGMSILTGFLNAVLAKSRSLGVAASVCFEQSYGLIDGDSATVAELVAILSALAEVPVRQNVAMTGSLNQFGDVQPVGGINEKIEGYFKTCEILGSAKSKKAGNIVLIPYQNVQNLMLHDDVQQAVEAGKFSIYPIKSINDAFEIATGMSLGYDSVHQREFAPGTALSIIAHKLEKLHKKHVEEAKLHQEVVIAAAKTPPAKRAAKAPRQPGTKQRTKQR
jgi:lon-related putative ATP-dependent protease